MEGERERKALLLVNSKVQIKLRTTDPRSAEITL